VLFLFTAMLMNAVFQIFVLVLRGPEIESVPPILRYSGGLPHSLKIIMVIGPQIGQRPLPHTLQFIIIFIPTLDVTSCQLLKASLNEPS
jgi:hypothetical protein